MMVRLTRKRNGADGHPTDISRSEWPDVTSAEFSLDNGATWHPTEAAAREHEESAGALALAKHMHEIGHKVLEAGGYEAYQWDELPALCRRAGVEVARRAIALGADPKKIGGE